LVLAALVVLVVAALEALVEILTALLVLPTRAEGEEVLLMLEQAVLLAAQVVLVL
jgi:hypothetical protein